MGCKHSKKLKRVDQNSPVSKSKVAQSDELSLPNEVCVDKDLLSELSEYSTLGMRAASNAGEKRKDGVPSLVAGRYKVIGDALACGAFGCVYKALNINEPGNMGKLYAVKIENLENNEYPQLEHEARMYRVLDGGLGIPHCYAYEAVDDKAVMVMDMLGNSLQSLFHQCGDRFSVKTCLMLAEQMISRVQYMHENNYVHRDLKPANFVVGYPGTKEQNIIFLLDFGLSKKWRNHLTKELRPFEQRYYGTVGTDMFASRIAHEGMEQARRDDLESLGYILLYFMNCLPWANAAVEQDTVKIVEEIRDKKKNMRLQEYSKAIPKEFLEYLQICRGMAYDEEPNYKHLKGLFRNCAKNLNIPYPYDCNFDWK